MTAGAPGPPLRSGATGLSTPVRRPGNGEVSLDDSTEAARDAARVYREVMAAREGNPAPERAPRRHVSPRRNSFA